MTAAFGKRGARIEPAGRIARGAAAPMQSRAAPAPVAAERSFTGTLKSIGACLLMLALAAGVVFIYGGGIVRDFRHGSDYVVDASIKVTEAKCSRSAFVFSQCDIKLASGPRTEKLTFAVLFASLADERVVPLRSAADPTILSTQSSYERRYNRAITLFLTTVLMLSLALVAAVKGFPEGERR